MLNKPKKITKSPGVYLFKNKDEQIIYNLTSDQLNFANKLRSICNQFRVNADKIINKHKYEIIKFEKIIKNDYKNNKKEYIDVRIGDRVYSQ